MDNPLLTSNSSLIIKRLRKKKLTTKKHLYLDRSKINELNYLIHDSPVRVPVEFMKGLKDAVECIEDLQERIDIMEEGNS